MKKRVLSLFLCFVLCLSLCPTAAFADGEDGHTHEPEETAPLVVSATMAPEVTEAPVEPAAEPEAEPEEEPAEPTPEPAPETPAETAPEAETEPTPEPTAESTPEATAEPVSEPEAPVVDDAVAAVQALIDALPAVDSVSAEDYDAVQNAYDAYDALTAEQRSHITGAEAFEALFNWFNEQVMELAESCTYDENGFCQNKDYTDNNHNYINCYEPAELDSDGYYQIGNAGQLYWFADWVNDGHPDSNAELTGDITVNSGKFGEGGNYTGTDTPRKFSWIGQSSYLYKGTFNGNNYTIYGLYYKAKESGKTGTVGLFRPDGATIKNLTIDNMYISAPQSTVGLIVEDNCSVTVENVTVQNSYIISQNAGTVGAIVAKLKSGSVSNCRSINNVVQGKSRVGAIVGWNDDGTVKNCYSTGTVSGTSQVGAIVGYNNRGSVDNCYYLADEETTMQNGVAGKTEAQFKSGEVAYLLNESKNNGTWKQTIGTDAFPNFTGSAVYCTTPCPTYTNDAKNLDKEHNKVKGTCTVCGDGCKHTNWTDDGVCADCESTAVAKMTKGDATSYFMDLGKALLAAAADSGSTVTVLEDVSSNVAVDLSDYRSNITLDLNGKTVEGLSYKYGSERCPLTVKDSASGGTLTDLTLQSAAVTLTGGTVTALNMTGANVSISNGTVTTLKAEDYAEITISGGTVGAVTFENGRLYDSGPSITLNVSGGTVTAITGGVGSKIAVSGTGTVATLNADSYAAEVAVSAGTVKTLNVKDGKVSLTGGSYERITGADTITLGDLLPAGKVFAKGGDVKRYSTKLSSDGIELTDYSITACDHNCDLDDVGCCVNCGADREVIIVKANGAETKYATAAEAFAAAKGYTSATVTLRKDVHASETITLEKGTITLDLGGHTLSGGGYSVLDLNGSATLIVNAASGGTIRNTHEGWNEPIAVSENAKLTLASTQVTQDSDGDLKLSGGETTIQAGANIQVNVSITDGKLTVTGGTMKNLTANGGDVKLSGGHFEKIETCTEGKAVRDLLKLGYAFKDSSSAFILWGNTDINSSSCSNVDVAACVHQANVLGSECLYCGKPLVAQLVAVDGETSFYTSFADVLAAAPMTGESVITLLKNCGDGSATHQVNKTLRLILGGHELKDTLEITAGGCLTVANSSGSTLAAIEQTGGTLKVNPDAQATIKTLTVSGGETKLSGGTYNSITVTAAGKTVGDLLAENSAYYQTAAGGGKTWLTVKNETALQNVSVGRIPLLDITLTASPESLTYGDVLTLTADHVYGATYKWFEVVNGTENTITTPETDPYKLALRPNAGSHTYRCKVTKDGYTVTLDKTVTVAKAHIGNDFLTPKANTGLIYNGGAQALIQAGSFNGNTGCSIWYKLGADGTYGTDASALKGTDAKTYTVYYYVDGGTNYNDIGSADSPRKIKVTIAPRDLNRTDTRYINISSGDDLTYNGQPQAPTFTLTLKPRDDSTSSALIETLTLGTDYTQSVTKETDVGTYTATFTGKGNYTGTATVDWNIVKATAPTAADGTLLVYNQVARSYTFDFATLLPTLPRNCEYGKLSYALNAVGTEANASVITATGYLGDYSLSQSTLTLPVNAVNSTDTGAVAALRVTVTADHYENITLTLNVERINRVSPVDVAAPVEGLTKDNVTSDSREALETLRDDLADYLASDPLDDEREELEELQETVDELLKQLDEAKAAMEDDAIGAVDDIDASNAKPGHKGKLRSAKKAAQAALEKFGPNYTAKEKDALNDTIARIDAALAAIDKAESDAKKADANKPVKTGDESTPILWIVLIVAAAGCVVVLIAARKKKK